MTKVAAHWLWQFRMLFNSYTFIFAFLPITLLVYYGLGRIAPRRVAILWLVVASLFFYGWERPENLPILGALLVFNYYGGIFLGRHAGSASGRWALGVGVALNLAVLAYYKYANFLLDVAASMTGFHSTLPDIILPLGISFFVFQKIAYLVDAYRGQTRGYNFIDYSLFVTFFPQLIAGPIVHHKEVIPQFAKDRRTTAEDWSVGITQFVCGLFKKVVIADRMALYASPIFDSVGADGAPTFADAWVAALAYTFQIYFDFSGYSDMALGLGRLFGVKLPLNFNSPYKAINIADFWRRWHITLSRFLRDYLYIPLGGNRKGPSRRYLNLMITMLLGGLWHGAGWTFIIWGALHGGYLVLHQGWIAACSRWPWAAAVAAALGSVGARVITVLAVIVAWVFFRSADLDTAGQMLKSMAGLNGFDFTSSVKLSSFAIRVALLSVLVWYLPNTQQWLARFQPALTHEGLGLSPVEGSKPLARFEWKPSKVWAAAVAVIAVYSVTQMSRVSEFIYWQF